MVRMNKLVNVCDECDDERIAHSKCKFCGKDLCEDCGIDEEDNKLVFRSTNFDAVFEKFLLCSVCSEKVNNPIFFNKGIKKEIKDKLIEYVRMKLTAHKL